MENLVTDKPSMLYNLDFYGWTQEQAKLLQEGKWNCLDIPIISFQNSLWYL